MAALNTSAENQDFARDESGSRLVWVLNRDVKSYKGTFEGKKIEIPGINADGSYQKIAKHVVDGGNLMPYISARSFITDFKEPQEFVMDRAGKPQPVFGPKALFDQELTAEEFNEIVKKTPKQVKLGNAQLEKEARRALKDGLSKRAGKAMIEAEDDDV